jgi:hypothetical protein
MLHDKPTRLQVHFYYTEIQLEVPLPNCAKAALTAIGGELNSRVAGEPNQCMW